MSKAFLIVVAAASALALTGAPPAAAAIMLATFTGTVVREHDPLNELGFDVNPAGLRFRAVYRYDTLRGGVQDVGPHHEMRLQSGPDPAPGPVLSAKVRVGGKTFDPGTAGSNVSTFDPAYFGGPIGEMFHQVQRSGGRSMYFSSLAEGNPSRLDASFDGAIFGESAEGNGAYEVQVYDVEDARTYFLIFDATHLTVTAAVPEPASWALLVGGLGMAGAALRRRRRDPSCTG